MLILTLGLTILRSPAQHRSPISLQKSILRLSFWNVQRHIREKAFNQSTSKDVTTTVIVNILLEQQFSEYTQWRNILLLEHDSDSD